MSAYIVDKVEIDLLVRAALHAHRAQYAGDGRFFSWWRTDEEGEFAGWNELRVNAEDMSGDDYKQYVTPSTLGQILVNENVTSVGYRYSTPGRTVYYGAEAAAEMEDDDMLPGPCDRYYIGPYVYADPRRDLTPGEVFQAIDCLDYQSCEHPGWRKSEAFAFLTSLRKAYCDRVAYDESAVAL